MAITKRDDEAYINDTRIPVWSIVESLRVGLTVDDIVYDTFPSIDKQDVLDALVYYALNRDEIETAIKANDIQ